MLRYYGILFSCGHYKKIRTAEAAFLFGFYKHRLTGGAKNCPMKPLQQKLNNETITKGRLFFLSSAFPYSYFVRIQTNKLVSLW